MADVWVAWLAFAVLAASPGPSIMAIMGTSLAYGRRAVLFAFVGLRLLSWRT